MADIATPEPSDTPVDDTPVENTPVVDSQIPAADELSGGDPSAGAGPAFSAETVSLAETYGLDPSHFASEDAVRNMASFLESQFEAWQRSQPQHQSQPQGNPAQREEQRTQQPSQFDLDKLFPPDAFDDVARNGFKSLHSHFDERLKPLSDLAGQFQSVQQQVEALKAYHQQQEEKRFEQEMDDWFSKAPDTHKGRFGSGAFRSLKLPTQKEARNSVVAEVYRLADADSKSGRQMLSPSQYADRALHILFGNDHKQNARADIVKQLANRKNAALPGANGKQSQPLTGEDRAWATYKAKAEKAGIRQLSDD